MSQQLWYRFGRFVIKVYARLMIRMDVVWQAPLPAGPKIIAINHPSTSDPALLMAIAPEHTAILISETLFKIPVLGGYLHRAGHVPVLHENGRAALEEGIRLLKAGRTVGIAPEGAISPLEGGFCKAHTGVARLALASGAPVIPVGIGLQGDRVQLKETKVDGRKEVATLYLHGAYAVTVGEALHFTGNVEDRAYVRSVSQQIMQRIMQLSHESRRRLATPPALPGAKITWTLGID